MPALSPLGIMAWHVHVFSEPQALPSGKWVMMVLPPLVGVRVNATGNLFVECRAQSQASKDTPACLLVPPVKC